MASDREITLGNVWSAIWRGKWIVVGVTVVAALVAFALTYTQDTTYTATSKVYLGQATTMMGNLASTPGTNPLTAATVLQGDRVVGAVAKATGLTPSTVRSRTDQIASGNAISSARPSAAKLSCTCCASRSIRRGQSSGMGSARYRVAHRSLDLGPP